MNLNLIYSGLIPLFSAFFGGFISIWVYRKGIIEQKKVEKRKQIEDNNETEEYFKLNIKSIIQFIDYQVDEISKISKKTKDWESRNLSLPIKSELKLTEIREIDFKSLFQILVLNRKGKSKEKSSDFINIKNCLHNIEDFVLTHENINKVIHDKINKDSELWNNSMENLLQFNNKYVQSGILENDTLMILIQNKVVLKQREMINKNLGNNLDSIYKEVIDPIIIQIPSLNQRDPRVPELLEILIKIKKAYQSSKNFKYQRRKSLLISGRRLLNIKRLLQQSMKSIEARKKIH